MIGLDILHFSHHLASRKKIIPLLVLILVVLLLPVTTSAAEQGSYVRKSITALDSVWVFPQARRLVQSEWAFDLDRFQQYVQHYIELPRFDFNEIPAQLKKDFNKKANSLPSIETNTLTQLLETTVVEEIIAILNDPEIQQVRSTNFKDEASFQTFAATKAKSLGLTSSELAALFNSAYIYLPFISSASVVWSDEGYDTIHIYGGIIWWKVEVDSLGKTTVRHIMTATTYTMGFVDYNRSSYEFSFGNLVWYLSAFEYAVNDAMLAFAKNLSVKTREINDFKLQAQVLEKTGKTIGFPLGKQEGIHLDDGFYIVEYQEDAQGNPVAHEKGYVRVSRPGDNRDNPSELSYATHIMGTPAVIGDVLMENPRLGIDLSLYGGLTTGSSIEPEHTKGSSTSFGITDTATQQINLNALFSYNMAPVLDISQLFLTFDIGIGFPNGTTDTSAGITVVSPYLGISKGIGRRLYARGSAAIGLDILGIEYTNSGDTFLLTHRAVGIKGLVELGYMLTPNWRVALFGSYKKSLSVYDTTLEKNGIPQIFPGSTQGLELGGVSAGIGLSYALGSLPFNLFGFLDLFTQ